MIQLAPTPDRFESLIVVGTTVRKQADVLKAYLDSLAHQELPQRTRLHFVFVDDNSPPDASQLLKAWVQERGGEILRGGPSAVGDFSDQHAVTHQWSVSAMQRVAQNKNRVLQRALELKADAVWLPDADLVMDRTTLKSLASTDRAIACAVYYTFWNKTGHETLQLHAAPQVWLRHPYQLDGRGMDEFEFRRKLLSRGLVRVWGQGACSLIRRPVLEAGVDFTHLPDIPLQGMMAGEDRHFCIKAERRHIEMWSDNWPDIYHIYHLPDDLKQLPAMIARLGAEHPTKARLGDLISVKIQALEPMPMPNNQWTQVPSQHVRGRLGQLALLPELEEAIWNMERGAEQIIPVHIPYDYPIAYLRGRRRLMRVHFVDCKPFSLPPVVEDEMFVGELSKRYYESCYFSEKQLEGMKEVAHA